MSFLDDLPKDPTSAFQKILSEAQTEAEGYASSNLNSQQKTSSKVKVRMLQSISKRLENHDDYTDPLERAVGAIMNSKPPHLAQALEEISRLFIANSLQDHFLDEESEEQMNTMDWQRSDRDAVLVVLSKIRRIATGSIEFDDNHKRRLIHWVSKAENEVLKEKGKLATILGAVSEIGETIGDLGKKAEPIADLIQKIRTTTRRNVTEQRQLDAPHEPKKLSPPADDD